jgi:hypothetical protein
MCSLWMMQGRVQVKQGTGQQGEISVTGYALLVDSARSIFWIRNSSHVAVTCDETGGRDRLIDRQSITYYICKAPNSPNLSR